MLLPQHRILFARLSGLWHFTAAVILFFVAATLVLSGRTVEAGVVTPTNDAEVVEVLPAASTDRAQLRALRRALTHNPRDLTSALTLSNLYLGQAREEGDARFAGLALAVLSPWPAPAKAPDEVLLMQATIQQFLHDFDLAGDNLEVLVRRRPEHAQAWLTLATVRRVQGRYAESNKACAALLTANVVLYAKACRAENDSLMGDFDAARTALTTLLADRRLPGGTRNWLLITLAESEERAQLPSQAENAYRDAMKAQKDSYTELSYADFLLQQGRFAEVLDLLKHQPPSDAVLLRRSIAGLATGAPGHIRDIQELRGRMTLANLRPEARSAHARERAMFALMVDHQPCEAVAFSRENVRHQREPLDVLIFAQSAAACSTPGTAQELAALVDEMGIHDRRLDILR